MAKEEATNGDYTDYLLLSSSDLSAGWKHNIMRLAPASSTDVTDPNRWSMSKLNRRDMRRVRREEEEMARKAAEAEAGTAGTEDAGTAAAAATAPGPGMPGFSVKKEKEERDESLVAPGPGGASSSKASSQPRPRDNSFKRTFGAPKKTKRVYITEESTKNRRIAFEEGHPWVLETIDDAKPAQKTRWIGKMDAGASAAANGGEGSSYALLVLDNTGTGADAAFKVVPANRWYKFASRPKYHVLNNEEVEEEYKRMQKAGDMDSWFSHRRAVPGSSNAAAGNPAAASRLVRGTDSFQGTGHAATGGYSARFAQARARDEEQVPRSRLKTVIGDRAANDADLFGDEEAAGPSQRRAGKTAVRPKRRQNLEDDQYEEFEFEAEFQDDEEGIGQVGDDVLEAEENKELEERIKRELRGANHLEGDFGAGIESAEEDDGISANLTRAGRKVKKLLKKKGRRGRPEDDEDEDDFDEDEDDDEDEDRRNPYASDQGEEDSDSEAERREEARRAKQRAQYQQAVPQRPTGPNVPGGLSRNKSVGPRYPGAADAVPTNNASRAPSTGPGSRAGSPAPGSLSRRATSPNLSGKPGSRAASPSPPPGSATKRKASDDANAAGSPTNSEGEPSKTGKRRKPGSPSPAPVPVAPGDDSALIPREDIVAFIKSKGPTTKELLKHFKTAMTRDPRNRDIILNVTKEVASITNGKLSLKQEFA